MLTITNGYVIDGNVAVPAIYPGPLLIQPFERKISEAGLAAIVDEARRLGLLDEATDFTGGGLPPGSQAANIRLVVDGVEKELVGDPSLSVTCHEIPCEVDPGTPEAFAAFWGQLGYLDGWIPNELGPSTTYHPERLAVMAIQPQPDPEGLRPQVLAWPLEGTFAQFGQPFAGDPDARCATVSGDDLEILLPVLNAANQLTVFLDSEDAARSLMARVLVPGEESVCGDEGG